MKRIVAFFLPLVLFPMGNTGISYEAAMDNNVRLEEILKKTGKYCERLKRIAFHFVCHENITERTNFYNRHRVMSRSEVTGEMIEITDLKFKNFKINTYIYDYQLVKKGKEIEDIKERRILLRENRRKKHVENAEFKLKRFKSKNLIFGPVGFLSYYWQQHFDYSILGQDKIEGKEAIVISASPKEPREENYNFGKIWIHKDDCSVLKIELDPRSIIDFQEKVPSSIGDLKRSISWVVFYGIEKNGVKFPSKQIINEKISSHPGKEHPKYTVTIIYDHYKFFIVETEVKY